MPCNKIAGCTLIYPLFWGTNRGAIFVMIILQRYILGQMKGGAVMAKKNGGGTSPYAGNSGNPVNATGIKKGGTTSIKIITPKGK